MVNGGVRLLQIHDAADNRIYALALQLLLIGVEILLQSIEVDVEKDSPMVQGLLAFALVSSQIQAVG